MKTFFAKLSHYIRKKVLDKINNVYSLGNINKIEFIKAIEDNRKVINTFERWIENESIINSRFRYGVPEHIDHLLAKKINQQPTYSDLLLYLLRKIGDNVSYLEIGVSVGKNFIQMVSNKSHSSFVALDIEEPNPVVFRLFEHKGEESLNNHDIDSFVKKFYYQYNHNLIEYIVGDELSENTWKPLVGKKFDIIFSDALHEPEAIAFEYKQIISKGLFKEKFAYVFDDLGGGMTETFNNIYRDLKDNHGHSGLKKSIIKVNGWLGEHEHMHSVGVITNLL